MKRLKKSCGYLSSAVVAQTGMKDLCCGRSSALGDIQTLALGIELALALVEVPSESGYRSR